MKLSETQGLILSKASQHPLQFVAPPDKLGAAPRDAVRRSMLKTGLIKLVPQTGIRVRDLATGWNVGAEIRNYRITDVGLRAIGVEPDEATTGEDAGTLAAPAAAVVQPDQPAQEAAQEAAQDAPLAQEIALLDQALAAPAATLRASLRDAAAAILAAWDDEANREGDMIGALDARMEVLRATLASKPRPHAAPARLAA